MFPCTNFNKTMSLLTLFAQLFINTAHARFVCVDIFGSNIYLFGDIHSTPYGNDHVTGYENIERTQITNILDNLKNKTEPICILTEDLFAIQGKTLKEKALNSFRFGTIRGLTQRINNLNKPNIQATSIEKRFHIARAISFFNTMRELPFNGDHAPEKIVSGKYPNNYKITFADLCKEIQVCRNELQTLCNTDSFNTTVKGIINNNIQQIDSCYKQITDYLEINNIKQSDIILEKALEIHLSDIEKTFDQSPQFTQLFPRFKNALKTFASIYPHQQDKQTWIAYTQYIERLRDAINRCPRTKSTIESRTPMYTALMDIGILIVDTFTFINILKNTQKTVAVFAGALHTQNLKDMLIKAGLEYNNKISRPYYDFPTVLYSEELTFPRTETSSSSNLNDNTPPLSLHVRRFNPRYERLKRLIHKLTSIPVIVTLGALGTYLLARSNAKNSIAGTIIGALSAATAGGLTIAKVYQSCRNT